ncbi:hypothetical protein MKEN_00308900 [Mycena kentingensis (nom. inval.)]|nr:hypothetical protein MKEN_00308900 [Mycena kentingensis (nom. inval.)]
MHRSSLHQKSTSKSASYCHKRHMAYDMAYNAPHLFPNPDSQPKSAQITFPLHTTTVTIAHSPKDAERLLHALRSYSYECEFERNTIAMKIHRLMLEVQHLRNIMNEAEIKLQGARQDIGTARDIIYSAGLHASTVETCTICKDISFADV